MNAPKFMTNILNKIIRTLEIITLAIYIPLDNKILHLKYMKSWI